MLGWNFDESKVLFEKWNKIEFSYGSFSYPFIFQYYSSYKSDTLWIGNGNKNQGLCSEEGLISFIFQFLISFVFKTDAMEQFTACMMQVVNCDVGGSCVLLSRQNNWWNMALIIDSQVLFIKTLLSF